MTTELAKTDWSTFELTDIESFGSDIQLVISERMTEMLSNTKCINLEGTGRCLSDLSVEANSLTRKISGVKSLPKILKVSKWLARFDDIEGRLQSLENGVVAEKERLNTVLNGMYESLHFMRDKLVDLQNCQNDLQSAVDYFQSDEYDNDGLKFQASVSRLKNISTTVAIVKQECVKTALIIKENKEISAQLAEAADNLIPIFKLEMMNVLGAKTNSEAVKLKESLSETVNKLIVDSAKQIDKTADDLIKGRASTLVDVKSIQEANSIIQTAIDKVQQSALSEVQANLDSIAQLQDSLSKINVLALENFEEVFDGEESVQTIE